MRLIDAEKFRDDLYRQYEFIKVDDFQVWAVVDVDEVLDNTEEVKAIPVEWLHSIMERQLIFAMNSEMEGTTTVQEGVIHCVNGALACQVLANVIELWEKEKMRKEVMK